MRSLKERQEERALRAAAGARGEDISAMLDSTQAQEEKEAAAARREEAELAIPVQPQFAIPVRNADPVNGGVSKVITDSDGNEVDGDPANKKKASEAAPKVSAETKKEAAKLASAAASVSAWTANAGNAGNGGGTEKK